MKLSILARITSRANFAIRSRLGAIARGWPFKISLCLLRAIVQQTPHAHSSIRSGNRCRLLVVNGCISALSASRRVVLILEVSNLSFDRLNVSLWFTTLRLLDVLLQVPVREFLVRQVRRIKLPEPARFEPLLFSTESLIVKSAWEPDNPEVMTRSTMTPYR